MKKKEYKRILRDLQIELVKLQRHIISHDDRIVVVFEGRDGAGKDGTIKRIIQHLSPREVRVVALGKPSERETGSWYFQRFVAHLPGPQEMVLFNRSWYNRAGVEHVMGYCTEDEYQQFMEMAPRFEEMLIASGIKLVKYYLDISHAEQKRRLRARVENPLKQWKESPVDQAALRHWKDYSKARNAMLARTHTGIAPWTMVHAEDKRPARINVIRDLLSRMEYRDRKNDLLKVDPNIVFTYDPAYLEKGMIAN